MKSLNLFFFVSCTIFLSQPSFAAAKYKILAMKCVGTEEDGNGYVRVTFGPARNTITIQDRMMETKHTVKVNPKDLTLEVGDNTNFLETPPLQDKVGTSLYWLVKLTAKPEPIYL